MFYKFDLRQAAHLKVFLRGLEWDTGEMLWQRKQDTTFEFYNEIPAKEAVHLWQIINSSEKADVQAIIVRVVSISFIYYN